MFGRIQVEQMEEEKLSEFAALSSQTKGRQYPEDECSLRTSFQRDRDRIIHCKAFRRLKHKTQVFISPEGDHYRTRLTHTLEVSQISRTVARSLKLNEDLVEAIALGHDLGHTPFGHAGEDVLNKLYASGFHHNHQSLRIITSLENNKGLNLTWEVRDGIAYHTGPIIPQTLEGQLVRICDRIAYINHDLDDAIRAGIIREGDLPQKCKEVLGWRHRDRIDVMIRDLVDNSWKKTTITQSKEVGDATEWLRDFLFSHVYIGSPAKREEEKAKRLLKSLYLFYLDRPDDLSQFALERLKQDPLDRVVCDYIAGMTDRYAIYKYLHYCTQYPHYPSDREVLERLIIPE